MSRFLRLNCLIYRGVLLAYPPALRDQFEADILEAFAEDLNARWGTLRWAGLMTVWACALFELGAIALPGRLADPRLRGPLLSLALHLSLACCAILVAIAFRESGPHPVLHGVVSLGLHP